MRRDLIAASRRETENMLDLTGCTACGNVENGRTRSCAHGNLHHKISTLFPKQVLIGEPLTARGELLDSFPLQVDSISYIIRQVPVIQIPNI